MNYTESLILWYLRFNGYFATPNFTTHPDFKKESGSSDADVLAVRFEHSDECQRRFTFERDRNVIRDIPIDIVLADVKSSHCGLNDTWTNPVHENVEYALRWIGRWKDSARISQIATDIYKCGEWLNTADGEVVRFVSFGKARDETLAASYPAVSQIVFSQVIEYMRSRMTKGCYQIHRERWEPFIRELGERFETKQAMEEILQWILGKTS